MDEMAKDIVQVLERNKEPMTSMEINRELNHKYTSQQLGIKARNMDVVGRDSLKGSGGDSRVKWSLKRGYQENSDISTSRITDSPSNLGYKYRVGYYLELTEKVLTEIAEKPGITCAELAESINRDKRAVKKVIDRYLEEGLIYIENDGKKLNKKPLKHKHAEEVRKGNRICTR